MTAVPGFSQFLGYFGMKFHLHLLAIGSLLLLASGWLPMASAQDVPVPPAVEEEAAPTTSDDPVVETPEDIATLADVDNVITAFPLLGEVLARTKQNHYEDPGVHQLVEGAIRGLLKTLDPYSQYYDADAYQELQTDTRGKFGGLGMYIGLKANRLTVISPIEDTPAYRAGVTSGDIISDIDGESTAGITADEAANKMRGEPGTDVTLTIVRVGLDAPLTITITRDIITVISVKYRKLKDNIGYLRITGFMQPTAEAAAEAIEALEADGVDGLILDLRSNPGGLLSSAVQIASMFLDEGELIVYTQGRGKHEEFFVTKKLADTNLPLTVLVNNGSASASEIVAGALQANDRAILMGNRTFGKASVQKIYPIQEGDRATAVKLTIAHYYTPDDIDIHEVGIEPNVKLEALSALEARMWRRARASDAMKELLKDEDGDILERLEARRPRDTTSPLTRKYRAFIDALEEDDIILGNGLLRYAIALETPDEADNYEHDPQIRSAVQYLRAFDAFRKLRVSPVEVPSEL
jgi:carboxyl-terminal processing protease